MVIEPDKRLAAAVAYRLWLVARDLRDSRRWALVPGHDDALIDDLARQGIASLLVERNRGLSPLPRATAVSVRTMELLRSFGLEDEVRAGQLEIAAVGAWAAETLASPDGALLPLGHPDFEEAAAASPTTPAGVPQDHLEPVLLRHLERLGLAEVRFGTDLVTLDQSGSDRSRRPRSAPRPARRNGCRARRVGTCGKERRIAGWNSRYRGPLRGH